MNELVKRLEALLLVNGESTSFLEAGELLSCSADEIRLFGEVLAKSLQGHGVCLIMGPSEMSVATSPDVSEWIANINKGGSQELSAAATETLAIVAYRGPISQSEVSLLRGVDSRRMLRQLRSRGLVEQFNYEGTRSY